jgi:hypothetical protein
MLLDDWIDKLRSNDGETVWLMQISSKVLDRKGAPRGDKLIGPWLRQLAAAPAARASPATWWRATPRSSWRRSIPAPPMRRWRTWWRCGAPTWTGRWRWPARPRWPTWPAATRAKYTTAASRSTAKSTTPCLARLWPEFAVLRAAGDWPRTAEALYGRWRLAARQRHGDAASAKKGRRSMSQLLQPLSFPLHGSRLIEASAGTGKTWTIAALYLRLVLGHGNADGEETGFLRRCCRPRSW